MSEYEERLWNYQTAMAMARQMGCLEVICDTRKEVNPWIEL